MTSSEGHPVHIGGESRLLPDRTCSSSKVPPRKYHVNRSMSVHPTAAQAPGDLGCGCIWQSAAARIELVETVAVPIHRDPFIPQVRGTITHCRLRDCGSSDHAGTM